MPEDRDQLIQRFREMRAATHAAIEGLSDAQLTDPSIDGWSVKDHMAHLALWDEIRASEVVRISAGHDSAWRTTPQLDDTLNDLAYALRSDLSLDQVRWEFDASHQRLLEAIAAATEQGLDASRYGEASLVSTHEAQHTQWIARWRAQNGF